LYLDRPDKCVPEEFDWKEFSLREEVKKYEAEIILRALKDANRSVTKAARLLGFKHHHSLTSLINVRHPELAAARAPVRRRLRSIIRNTRERPKKERITILHVEDHEIVANLVKAMLAEKVWTWKLVLLGPWQYHDCAGPGVTT